jgi:hypothetical protein
MDMTGGQCLDRLKLHALRGILSRSGQRVAAMRRRSASSSSGTLTLNGRISVAVWAVLLTTTRRRGVT